MTYIERALSLIVSAGDSRVPGARDEMTARAQVFALLAIAGTLERIAKEMFTVRNGG